MPEPMTICGYGLGDVRRSLRDAIDRVDRRAANRWTAELVVTPAAVGSLWSVFWVAWACNLGPGGARACAASGPSPTLAILLRQTWDQITAAATAYAGDWPAFRNDPQVRGIAAEMMMRLLTQPRQTPVVWPSKEVILYDVSAMRETPVPAAADGSVVLSVWHRTDDALELRLMAGRFLAAVERGDLRMALSAVAWTMMPTAVTSLKAMERGQASLTAKQRASPLWFWLELGAAYMSAKPQLHRGWITAHRATVDACKSHYKRWSAADRMRILLAWVLQMRAVLQPAPDSLWVAPPLEITAAEIDLSYREVAAELTDPEAACRPAAAAVATTEKDKKREAASRAEARMAEADAKIMALMGLSDE